MRAAISCAPTRLLCRSAALEKLGPPLRMIAPGRVFRNESVDASHEHTFYQLEGMMIDRNVSVGNLIYFMKTLLTAIFKRDVTVRLRPGFFPFVEPGFRPRHPLSDLRRGRLPGVQAERLGRTAALRPGEPACFTQERHRPDGWNGFAFGLGLTRLVIMRYAIDDIRWLQSGDLRFLRQF